MKTVLMRMSRIALLLMVAGTVLNTTGCDGGQVYMGVSVAGPYYGYPYGGGYPHGVGVYGRLHHW